MTSELTNQLATELLVSSLLGVLALAVLTTALVLILVRRRRLLHQQRLARIRMENSAGSAYRPSLFESACRWLVVKSTRVEAVQSALGLHNPFPCSWGEALSRSTPGSLFVSPPVRGWILVIGPGLPDPSEDVDRCYHFIVKLSRALGHIQFFSAHRALNHHAWIRAERGQIRRAYAWAGETVWNQGPVSQAERDLGLLCYEYGESPNLMELSPSANPVPNAEKIMQLANRWSLDPTTIDERMLPPALGIAGDISTARGR